LSHLIAVLAVEEDHQQYGVINFDGPDEHDVFDLNLEASNHQDGDINFNGPHDYGAFDLNLEASDHQQEMRQMISKPQISNPFYLFFQCNID
jgi:hypothetical protein